MLYEVITLLEKGALSSKAGYLCLEQDLGKDSAVTFFLTSKGKNYQALYQKASIIGHRLYLASNYLGYGCSGIGAYRITSYNVCYTKLLRESQIILI